MSLTPASAVSTDQPRLSIVIPAYNCAQYVAAAVRSCLDQQAGVHEVIVVDDGSTDETPEVLRQFEDEPRVKLLRQTNGGVSRARNLGITEASGDYVAFLDADDLLLPHATAAYLGVLRRYPHLDVIFADYWLSNTPGARFSAQRSFGGPDKVVGRFAEPGDGCLHLLPEFGTAYRTTEVPNSFVHTSAILIRRALLETIGGFQPGRLVAEDYDLWGRAFSNGRTALVIGDPVSEYFRWRGTTEKYEATYLGTIARLEAKLTNASALSAEWRRLRRQIAREYLSMIYAMGVVRAPRGRLARALAASIRAYPLPRQQMRYLLILLLPRSLVRHLVHRKGG